MENYSEKHGQRYLTVCLCTILFAVSIMVAGPGQLKANEGPWWKIVPEEENPSPYYDSILYSEIASRLREIKLNSNRVKVDVIGQSAGGRNLFLVTLSAPESMGRKKP